MILQCLLFLITSLITFEAFGYQLKRQRSSSEQQSLNKFIHPIQYDIVLDFHEWPTTNEITYLRQGRSFAFRGNVMLMLNVSRRVNTIGLHSKNLAILNCNLYREQNQMQSCNVRQSFTNNQITISSSNAVFDVGVYSLIMNYTGSITNGEDGLFWRTYYSVNGQRHFMVVSQGEPFGTRLIFPSFDEPAFKATFMLNVFVPENYVAYSNGMETQRRRVDKPVGYTLFSFKRSPVMSAYLFALVIAPDGDRVSGGYKCITDLAADRGRTQMCVPNESTQYAQLLLPKAIDLLAYFEQQSGILYPMEKLLHVAVPDFDSEAMENWGMITYSKPSLYGPRSNNIQSIMESTDLMAHEIAHQWFGNLVTMNWWNDLWLNEGFATFWEYEALRHYGAEWNSYANSVIQRRRNQLKRREGGNDVLPLVLSDTSRNVMDLQDIVYDKGLAILQMLKAVLGHEVFFQGCRVYLNRHMYSSATTSDVWQAFTEAARLGSIVGPNNSYLDVGVFLYNWTYSAGYPEVNINQRCSGTSCQLNIRQSRKQSGRGGMSSMERDVIYHIPLFILVGSRQQVLWITERDTTKHVQINVGENLRVITDNDGYYDLRIN